jgi:N-acetylglucosamine-6-sulfatase
MRYPEAIKTPTVVNEMVLNMDVAPTLVDLCGVGGFPSTPGRSVVPLLRGDTKNWRTSFLYEYNFENEFPYTPNVRAVRTDTWKYIHYPNGGNTPDTEMAELYNVEADPIEANNLIAAPDAQAKLAELQQELQRLLRETGADPDRMPQSPQLRFELPNAAIR